MNIPGAPELTAVAAAVVGVAVLVCPVSEPVVFVLAATGVVFCDSVDAVLLPPVDVRCAFMPAAAASILSGMLKKRRSGFIESCAHAINACGEIHATSLNATNRNIAASCKKIIQPAKAESQCKSRENM